MKTKIRRSTPLKKEILNLLGKFHLLTATQVLEKLHQQGSDVNKTSVYRNLDTFLEDGVICQQSFGEELVYELQKDHHDHICCYVCGKVEEIPCQVKSFAPIKNYSIDHHHLTLYGLCEKCQQK
jgi:Fe2+ or Zn2+ uptake regulation protein